MQKVRIGDVDVHALIDGTVDLPVEMLFPDIEAAQWDMIHPPYVRDGMIPLTIAGFLICSREHRVLVDTGSGVAAASLNLPTGGIASGLRRIGVQPHEIDFVILSHLHADHVGGCTHERDGLYVPLYPEARYLIDEQEWNYWTIDERARTDPNASPAIIDACARPLAASGQLQFPEHGFSPTPNITLIPAPGHTPGHMNVLVHSRGEQMIIVGDCLHCPAQVAHPQWSIYAGVDKDLERESRSEILNRIACDRTAMAAGHLAGANFGSIVCDESGLFFQPLR